MRAPQHILFITYWPLTNALISTYTLPYLRIIQQQLPAGSTCHLVTLTPEAEKKSSYYKATLETIRKEGFNVADFQYQKFGPAFLIKMPFLFFRLWWLIVQKKIGILHCWCTPGGAIGYILKMVTGRTLILDSFEPHADAMVETGVWKSGGMSFRILFGLEKRQLRRARHVICAAPGMMDYAAKRYGITRVENFVKPACVDLTLFRHDHRGNRLSEGISDTDIVCVYAGKFGGIYLERETFDFFAVAANYWRGKFRILLLTSHSDEEILTYCKRSGLDPRLVTKRFVPHAEVPRYLSLGDFGICPVKPVATKRYCSPIKNGEYWAAGLPVVITRDISTDSMLIEQNNAGAVIREFTGADYNACCEAVAAILAEPGHRPRIRQLAVRHRNFSIAEKIYQEIYLPGAAQRD